MEGERSHISLSLVACYLLVLETRSRHNSWSLDSLPSGLLDRATLALVLE